MERSLLDDIDSDGGIDHKSTEVASTAGEITKRRRGRPPGSKNKAKEDSGLTTNLENAIRGLFGLLAVVLGFFGYEQTEELTESEAKEGARAFTPIAQKFPALATVATYIGAPVWLILTMRKKFARKARNDESHAERSSGSDSGGSPLPAIEGREATGTDSH